MASVTRVEASEPKNYIGQVNRSNSPINLSSPIKIAEVVNVGDEEEDTKKNPLVSAGLSFVIPGAGQIYNEEYIKGALLFVGVLGLAYLDFFIIEPTAKANDAVPVAQRKNNSLFDMGALFVRLGLPALWIYNWGSAYQAVDPVYQRKLKEEEKAKQQQQNQGLSNNTFDIKLVKINF
ncbi:hypothetical protein EON78_05000 [bacterium]|nr:MAG: hypothetical protein EON78_05000 [bacterium]